MQITIVHKIEFAAGTSPLATQADLNALESRLMSKILDLITQAQAEADAAVARANQDVAARDAKIAELQAQVDSGEASPEVEAALQKLIDTNKAIDPKQPDVLPTPSPTPENPPTPEPVPAP